MTRLAGLIEVTAKAVSDYEKGEYPPSDDTLARIAKATRFPVGFFSGGDLHEPIARYGKFPLDVPHDGWAARRGFGRGRARLHAQ